MCSIPEVLWNINRFLISSNSAITKIKIQVGEQQVQHPSMSHCFLCVVAIYMKQRHFICLQESLVQIIICKLLFVSWWTNYLRWNCKQITCVAGHGRNVIFLRGREVLWFASPIQLNILKPQNCQINLLTKSDWNDSENNNSSFVNGQFTCVHLRCVLCSCCCIKGRLCGIQWHLVVEWIARTKHFRMQCNKNFCFNLTSRLRKLRKCDFTKHN